MAAYRHLMPPVPPTNRVYGTPGPGGPNEHRLHPYDDHGNSVMSGQQASNSGQTNNSVTKVGIMNNTSGQQQQQQHQGSTNHHMPQQQFHHQQGMHLLQQQQQHPQQTHQHHLHHHHLSYQQFSVGGQHVNLARHLLATGQVHQQVLHSSQQAMKGMMYHGGGGVGGLRSAVVPLNASKLIVMPRGRASH